MEPMDLYARALVDAQRITKEISPDQLDLPTVCEKWSVRQLLNHLVSGQRMVAVAAGGDSSGSGPSAINRLTSQGEDVLGDDYHAAFAASSAAERAALSAPGVLESTIQMPWGKVPGRVTAMVRGGELLIHTWDLAQATGQSTDLDHEACDAFLAFSSKMMGDDRPESGPFKPQQPARPDATPADRLAAFAGRPVAR